MLPPTDAEKEAANNLVTCTPENDKCCAPWSVNADVWWLHHPDWEVTEENDQQFCFTPMANETQRQFLKELHEFQWGGNCSEVEKTVVVNSGFGSSIAWNTVSFFHAWKRSNTDMLPLKGEF